MNATEWTDLASVPVYPLAVLRRLDPSVRHAGGRIRAVRASLEHAVAQAYPGSLAALRIRLLPALQAVILLPVSVGHDLRGTPVPALVLDSMLRARGARRIGGVRRYFAATYRGYDRYVTSPAGLLTCGHVDSVPSGARFIDTCPRPRIRRRPDTLQPARRPRLPLNRTDHAALLISAAALLVHLAPEALWMGLPPAALAAGTGEVARAGTAGSGAVGTGVSGSGAEGAGVSRDRGAGPHRASGDQAHNVAATVRALQEIVPDLTLTSIQRTASGYHLSGYTPPESADAGNSARLAALPGVTAVRIGQANGPAGKRTEFQIEGETP